MADLLISIIIPTYKRPEMLGRAIRSVLSQTEPDLRIYVCDNASEDGTHAVVAEFCREDSRVRYFCHEKNIGMLPNYKFGLSLVKTPYFSFLSDDDILFPSFCADAIEEFKKYPNIAFAAGATLIISPELKLLSDPIKRWPREGYYPSIEGAFTMIGNFPIPNTVLFSTNKAISCLINEQNPFMWDCEFLLRLALQHPCSIFKKPSGLFISHPSSFSRNCPWDLWRKSLDTVIEVVEGFPCSAEKKQKGVLKLRQAQEDCMAQEIYSRLMHREHQPIRGLIQESKRKSPNLHSKWRKLFFLLIRAAPSLARCVYALHKKMKRRPPSIAQEYVRWLSYFSE